MSAAYADLMADGKRLAAEGRIFESLAKFEDAREIQETPKVLQRIKRLKEFIKQSNLPLPDSSFKKQEEPSTKKGSKPKTSPEEGQKNLDVLQEITNTDEVTKQTDSSKLSPASLIEFNKLKKEAMGYSYEGQFQDALNTFQKALHLCDCPVVKKYIKDIEVMISKHDTELEEFRQLTYSGKKLAHSGRKSESVKKLKDAYNICPSPKISRIIQTLDGGDSTVSKKLFSDSDSLYNDSAKAEVSKSPKLEVPLVVKPAAKVSEVSSSGSVDGSVRGSVSDLQALSPVTLCKFKNLYKKARVDASEGRLHESLSALREASAICSTDKIVKRIGDLEKIISETDEGEKDGDEMVEVTDGFYLFHGIYEKLYPYQRQGVSWMYELYKKRKGGVLGDDTGLGKTFQVIAFLSGLIDADLVKHVLIIMPVSLLTNWEREFTKWCPGIKVYLFHGSSKKERERNAHKVQRSGHVLLTSYGMVVNNLDSLDSMDGQRFIWDYVILDEGHKIKNPTKTTKAVHEIPAKNRLVLTGTPIQNNLRELWALYDFVHQGALLGSMKTFKMQYENIITRSREKDATVGEKRLGTEMAENLKKLIQPYFLRRTKNEIWGDESGQKAEMDDVECKMADLKISEDNRLSTRKNDFIVWLTMSEQQCEIYRNFLHSEAVKNILISKRSPLVELTTLKKICDHPRLLSQRACEQLGLNRQLDEEDLIKDEVDDETTSASSIENVPDETLITESVKMGFLIALLENLKENGHRTLVFSLSRKILDMVHRILLNRQWKVVRIDGTIAKTEERERRIQLFQRNSSYPVFLLTTQVGGVGITLTAADRVVIYDPSWNPATDAQAVDRAYRIGQKKNVVVYRLMTCGTVEEKIYRRQIFKDSITRQATGSSDPYRYFSKQELRELFVLENANYSATQVQLSQMHSGERKTDCSLDEHIAFLYSLGIFGISDHDLMFSKNIKDDTEDNDESAISHDYIKKQVALAQERIQAEAAVVEDGLRLAGSYTRPYTENIPTYKNNTEKDYYKPPSFPVIDLTNEPLDIKNSPSVRVYSDEEEEDNISTAATPKEGEKMHKVTSGKKKDKYKPLNLEKNKITDYYSPNDSLPEVSNRSSTPRKKHSLSKEEFKTPAESCEELKAREMHPQPMDVSPEKKSESSYSTNDSVIYEGTRRSSDSAESEKANLSSDSAESEKANLSSDSDSAGRSLNETRKSGRLENVHSGDLELNETAADLETRSFVEDSSQRQSLLESLAGEIEDASYENDSGREPEGEGTNEDASYENDSGREPEGEDRNEDASYENDSGREPEGEDENILPSLTAKNLETVTTYQSDVNRNSFLELSASQTSSENSSLDNPNDPSYLVEEENSPESAGAVTEQQLDENGAVSSSNRALDSAESQTGRFSFPGLPSRAGMKKSESKQTLHASLLHKSFPSDSYSGSLNQDDPELSEEEDADDGFGDSSAVPDSPSDHPQNRSALHSTDHPQSRSALCSGGSSADPDYPSDHPQNDSSMRRTSSPVAIERVKMPQDLTLFLNESLDLSITRHTSRLKNRKSCARNAQHLSESDSSERISSGANTSQELIVSESEEEEEVVYDPEKSVASIPLSVPSTPLASIPVSRSPRITPLRLHGNYVSPANSPFAKALASSPLIQIRADDDDSPLCFKKKRKNVISSDSESSGDEEFLSTPKSRPSHYSCSRVYDQSDSSSDD